MIEIFFLSVIQGITEFLPISSSSHLILISEFLNFKNQNLVYVNFANSNLSGSDLSFTDLRSSNLEGANLEGAKLEGAKLEGANLNCLNHEICIGNN